MIKKVIFALKRRGRPIYGFGNGYSLVRPERRKKKQPTRNADDD